jgi:hypothetical protein
MSKRGPDGKFVRADGGYTTVNSQMSPDWVKEEACRIEGRIREGWGRAIECLRRDVERMRKNALTRTAGHRRREI